MVGVSSVQVLFLLPAEILSVVLNLHGAGQRTTTVAIHAESRVTSVIIIIIKKGIMTGVFLLSFLLPLVALLVTCVIFFL